MAVSRRRIGVGVKERKLELIGPGMIPCSPNRVRNIVAGILNMVVVGELRHSREPKRGRGNQVVVKGKESGRSSAEVHCISEDCAHRDPELKMALEKKLHRFSSRIIPVLF